MKTNTSQQRVIRSQRVQHQSHSALIGPKSNLANTSPATAAHVHTPQQLVVSRIENGEDGTVSAIHVQCQCGAELIIDCLYHNA